MRMIFTTGQVGEVCKVAPRTVSKWFDSGRLRGFRIEDSQEWRIARHHLIQFMKVQGRDLAELDQYDEAQLERPGKYEVLVVGSDTGTEAALSAEFSCTCLYKETEISTISVSLHLVNGDSSPDCVIVDLGMKVVEGLSGKIMGGFLRSNIIKESPIALIGLLEDDNPLSSSELASFDATIRRPIDASLIAQMIRAQVEEKRIVEKK